MAQASIKVQTKIRPICPKREKDIDVQPQKIKEGLRRGMEEVIALTIPNAEYFKKYGQEKEIKIDKELMAKVLKEEIQKVNQRLPEYKRIADRIVRETEFPKTSTRKVKRYVFRKELGLV